MNIITHGYTMRGLAEASNRTVNWMAQYGCAGRTQVSYDTLTGRVYTHDLTGNSWVLLNSNIVKVCETSVHMSQQEIADAIAEAMEKEPQHVEHVAGMRLQGLKKACASIPDWSSCEDGKPVGQTLICYDPDEDRVFLKHLVGVRFVDEGIGYKCVVIAGVTSRRMSEGEVTDMICRAVEYRRLLGWPYI